METHRETSIRRAMATHRAGTICSRQRTWASARPSTRKVKSMGFDLYFKNEPMAGLISLEVKFCRGISKKELSAEI